MSWPVPAPGLVIRYAYLWGREHRAGREEGVKDRPCAIVMAVEIPAATKRRLGLDDVKSWIVLAEANEFIWPGPDLRPQPGAGAESVAFGFLPPALFRAVRDGFLALDKRRKAGIVPRT